MKKLNNNKNIFDRSIDRLNSILSFLLGKRQNKRFKDLQNQQTSNLTFVLLLITSICFIWVISGFYYVADNKVAVISRFGKFAKSVTGQKVGFDLPYPFGSIKIFSSTSSNLISNPSTQDIQVHSLRILKSLQNINVDLTSDLTKITFNLEFNYKVNDASLLADFADSDDDVVKIVAIEIFVNLHKYISSHDAKTLNNTNLVMISSSIKEDINKNLSLIGLSVDKLMITNFTAIQNTNTPIVNASHQESTSEIKNNNDDVRQLERLDRQKQDF